MGFVPVRQRNSEYVRYGSDIERKVFFFLSVFGLSLRSMNQLMANIWFWRWASQVPTHPLALPREVRSWNLSKDGVTTAPSVCIGWRDLRFVGEASKELVFARRCPKSQPYTSSHIAFPILAGHNSWKAKPSSCVNDCLNMINHFDIRNFRYRG